jgi:hypothetical protein
MASPSNLKIKCANSNCRRLILLPLMHGRTRPDLSWSGNIMCPACKHVCVYSGEKVDLGWAPDEDVVLFKRLHVCCIEVRCHDENCSARVRILLPVDASSVTELRTAIMDFERSLLLGEATLEGIAWSDGHPCHKVGGRVCPKPDPDWECALGTPPEEML